MLKMFAALLLLSSLSPWASAQTPVDGASIYKRCAACHLATGAGVPGAYPKLGRQVAGFAGNKQGREYLVTVISAGLTGELKIDDKVYHGYMPAQSTLTDEQVAAVLNHVVTSIAKAPASTKLFTADEVNMVRADHINAKAADTLKLRPAIQMVKLKTKA